MKVYSWLGFIKGKNQCVLERWKRIGFALQFRRCVFSFLILNMEKDSNYRLHKRDEQKKPMVPVALFLSSHPWSRQGKSWGCLRGILLSKQSEFRSRWRDHLIDKYKTNTESTMLSCLASRHPGIKWAIHQLDNQCYWLEVFSTHNRSIYLLSS